MIDAQLGRRNLTPMLASYLRGVRYFLEEHRCMRIAYLSSVAILQQVLLAFHQAVPSVAIAFSGLPKT